jgi:hypothetical protein
MKSFQLEINFSSGKTLLCDKIVVENSVNNAIKLNPTLNQEEVKQKTCTELNNFLDILKKVSQLTYISAIVDGCEVNINTKNIDYIKVIKE